MDMLRWSRLLCTLLLVTKYEVVRSLKCPTSASDWDRASRALQCQLPNYYHCLRDESGAHTEQCLPRVWIQPEMCPEFNPRVSRIDVYWCSVANCPTSLYWSNAVFMYPICYESGSLISPTKQGSSEYSGDEPSTDNLPLTAIIGIILGVSVIMICLVGVLIIVCKKRHKENTDNVSNMESRKNNQKYSDGQADENEKSEVNKLLGNEIPPESKEFTKDGCQVYVVGNRKPKEQKSVKTTESSVRVLVLVLNKPINQVEMNLEARKMFGPNYDYCWTLFYYQKHKQEKNVSLFPQNFNLHNASAKGAFENICEVVNKIEVDVNFVITVPLSTWSAQRDELTSFMEEDKSLCFKSVYW